MQRFSLGYYIEQKSDRWVTTVPCLRANPAGDYVSFADAEAAIAASVAERDAEIARLKEELSYSRSKTFAEALADLSAFKSERDKLKSRLAAIESEREGKIAVWLTPEDVLSFDRLCISGYVSFIVDHPKAHAPWALALASKLDAQREKWDPDYKPAPEPEPLMLGQWLVEWVEPSKQRAMIAFPGGQEYVTREHIEALDPGPQRDAILKAMDAKAKESNDE